MGLTYAVRKRLASQRKGFELPLRLLDTANRYEKRKDERALLELSVEERELLKLLLKEEQKVEGAVGQAEIFAPKKSKETTNPIAKSAQKTSCITGKTNWLTVRRYMLVRQIFLATSCFAFCSLA